MSREPKEKHITNSIKDWLLDRGYPLEMHVAQAFRRHRFSVDQSQYYEDPEEEGKWREIDILASWNDWDTRKQPDIGESKLLVQVTFVVECKMTKDPWIVFTHSTKQFRNLPCELRSYNEGSGQAVAELDKRQAVTALRFFDPLSECVGYGLTVMRDKGKDAAYEALFQAAKAAEALSSYTFDMPVLTPWFKLNIPVVVVDGILTSAFLALIFSEGSL
jgi:hypothetical protein